MSRQHAAARELARQGFRIFPVIPNDKRPLIKGWQARATTDERQIDAWWDETPDANIGLPTDDLLVVDLDPRNGSGDTMKMLRILYPDPPDSVASVTAGGGAHLIFALPQGVSVRGGTNLLGPGVDIKSHGGYIVAAGSQIGDRQYTWVRSPADAPLAPAPQWILDHCKRPEPKSSLAGKRLVEEDEDTIARIQHYLARKAPEAVESERDNTAIKVANEFFDEGAELTTAIEYLLQWNETKCHPPLDRDIIELKARSALNTRQKAVGSSAPNAPGFDAQEVAPRDDTALPDEPKAARPALTLLSYADAAADALAASAEPLIEDLLDRNAMSIWYGESNTGKTFVLLDAAWHIAAGRPWAGKETKQGAVVYVAAEGGKGILKRIRALKDRYPDAGDVPLHIVAAPVNLLQADADLKPLVDAVSSVPDVELVVIDTLSRAIAGGNENDSSDMGQIVKHLDLIRKHTKAHVAIVHHSGKDKAKGARGHSLLRAATDTEIEISEQTLLVTKQRDMEGDLRLFFTLKPARIGVSPRGKDVTSCTVDMNGMGPAEAEPLPLTPTLKAICVSLYTELKDDNPDKPTPITWKTMVQHSSNKGLDDSTYRGYLLALLENGWIKKNKRDQYVIRDVGLVGPLLDLP